MDWQGVENNDLLDAAEEAGFDLLLTCDENSQLSAEPYGPQTSAPDLIREPIERREANGFVPRIPESLEQLDLLLIP
jgi:hypothetical protein